MDDRSSRWHGRRVLVTGCTGFLGGAVVRDLLGRGAEVVGLVRDRAAAGVFFRHQLAGRVHVVHGRAEDLFRIHSALAVYEASAVFHLATADPAPLDQATTTVIEAVRRYDPRVPVVTARPAGPTPLPTEAGPSVSFGVARFADVFGGDPKTHRPTPAVVIAALTGDRFTPPAADPVRDRVSVQDAARACILVAESLADRPGPQLVDATFRSGWAWTDRELAAAVRDVAAGRAPQLSPVSPPVNPLGWAPAAGPADALREMIDWYRQFLTARVFSARPVDPARRAAA